MTIEVKLGQLVSENKDGKPFALESLRSLINSKVTPTLAFKFSEIAEAIEAKIINFQKQRLQLVKENGTEKLDENGKLYAYDPLPEKLSFVEEELRKLCDVTVELPWNKFDLDGFDPIVIGEMGALRWLFNRPAE